LTTTLNRGKHNHDRARFGRTWIQQGVKIDNLVQIAHNVIIGKHSIIAGKRAFPAAPASEKSDDAARSGSLAILQSRTTRLSRRKAHSKDLPGGAWFGSPAVPLPEAKRQNCLIHRGQAV